MGTAERVAEGPVVVPDQAVDEVERLGLDHELGVLGAEVLGHHLARARVSSYSRWPAKPMREGLARAPTAACAMSATTLDESRPPERKAPSGTSATSRRFDGRAQQRAEALLGLVAHRGRRSSAVRPAAREARAASSAAAAALPLSVTTMRVRGRQRADAAVEGARRRHVAVGEEERQRRRVALVRDVGVREERLHLGGEREEPRPVVVEERLLARRGRARAAAAAPSRPRARTRTCRRAPAPRRRPSPRRGAGSPRRRPGSGSGAASRASRAQLAEVVDLAVEDEPERAVLVRHRLARRVGQVDDAEPPVPEGEGRSRWNPSHPARDERDGPTSTGYVRDRRSRSDPEPRTVRTSR